MTDENLLMQKCLEITSKVLEKDLKAFINIKIGTSFCFTFNNQEPSIDTRKKSPSVIRRDIERKEEFKENIKREEEEKVKEKFESNNIGVEEKKYDDQIIEENCQRWKVKVFTDDIEKLDHHVKEDKNSKVFKYSSKFQDQNRCAIKSVNFVEKHRDKDGSYAVLEIILNSSQFSIGFVENERNWPKFVKKVERIGFNLTL